MGLGFRVRGFALERVERWKKLMFRVRIVGFGARGCGFKLAFWAVCRHRVPTVYTSPYSPEPQSIQIHEIECLASP